MPRLKSRGIPLALRGFAQRLRTAREEAELSVRDLASEADVGASTISLAEREMRLPDLAAVIRLSEVLGVRIGWLISAEPPMRGRTVTILVEDDGPEAERIRRDLRREFAGGPASERMIRRKSRHSSD